MKQRICASRWNLFAELSTILNSKRYSILFLRKIEWTLQPITDGYDSKSWIKSMKFHCLLTQTFVFFKWMFELVWNTHTKNATKSLAIICEVKTTPPGKLFFTANSLLFALPHAYSYECNKHLDIECSFQFEGI